MSVLLVGIGRWGEKHLRVLAELGQAVWVADVSPERREWAAERGVERTHLVADYHDALTRVDVVDIVTPADSHLDIAEAAMAAGRDCFVEKPLAASIGEARRLAALAGRDGRIVQVGHIFRFHPVTAALRAALAAGRIGRVRFASARFAGFKRPRTDVGVTQTDAIHYFDLFSYLLGRRATAVSGVQRDWLGRGLDDMSVTVVEYDDVVVTVQADYFVPGAHRECVIVGETGSLVADYGAGTLTLSAGEHRQRGDAWDAVETGTEVLPTRTDEPLRLELQAFLDACAGRVTCSVTATEGVHALEIVEAAARSSRLGRTVPLAELEPPVAC